MVCFHSLITVDQQIVMAKSVNSTDPCSKLRTSNKKAPNSSNHQASIPACEQSRSAAVDVVMFIAVVGALGFLLFPVLPYVKRLMVNVIDTIGNAASVAREAIAVAREAIDVLREEVSAAPMIYGFLGLSILFAVIALLAITVCTCRKCGRPGCRGLRKGAEFDIQLETEECVKNLTKDGVKYGVFELPRDHHRELEAELKKMAPPNGRAVLVFKGRCGCSVGRMEVPGPKKPRKVKK